MRRVLILCGVVIALSALSPAVARADTTTCTGTRVALVSLKVTNEPLIGVAGNTWAIANYTRTIVIYRVSGNTFCAATQDSGSFTTIAGTSPGGTGTIAGGETGVLSRSTRTAPFTADWNSSATTSGFIGTFDSSVPWTSLFFTSVSTIDLTWSAEIYQVSGHGCFVIRLDLGIFYDILG